MTDATFHDLTMALPPTIAAVAGLIVSLRNSKKANAIHVLVNSKMTEALKDVALAKAEIVELKAVIAKIVQT